MRRWLVKRPNDEVIVTIMKNKCDETYSFINLTKEHICPCRFSSMEEAIGKWEEYLRYLENEIKKME